MRPLSARYLWTRYLAARYLTAMGASAPLPFGLVSILIAAPADIFGIDPTQAILLEG